MSERVINIENVVDVTEDALIYIDSAGITSKIMFDECRKNWIEHVNKGDFVDWQGNPVHLAFEESRCVGERNMIGESPYVLLYGNEKLKIETKAPFNKKLSKVQKEFLAMLYNVAGVITFDMT